ncbi:hypothetical protein [Sutterella sp.]|uniref:hypothetical protein n=1 Tax=Sutterella sp. TaxID=1981025 RepID=UPI0026E03331|nr:hypothetical protein [Sutterella sp.]MDO5532583.1 hypothetical protein [Sutterella sp.]
MKHPEWMIADQMNVLLHRDDYTHHERELISAAFIGIATGTLGRDEAARSLKPLRGPHRGDEDLIRLINLLEGRKVKCP